MNALDRPVTGRVITHYYGRPLETLTREQLIIAIHRLGQMLETEREGHARSLSFMQACIDRAGR
jgi:hypothetical protein